MWFVGGGGVGVVVGAPFLVVGVVGCKVLSEIVCDFSRMRKKAGIVRKDGGLYPSPLLNRATPPNGNPLKLSV